MRKSIILVCIFIITNLFSVSAIAQVTQDTITTNILNFAFGQTYNLKVDQTYSRLAKRGLTSHFNLGYIYAKNNNMINIQCSYTTGKLKSKGNRVNIIMVYSGNLTIKYLKKMNKINLPNFAVYIGSHVGFREEMWFPKNNVLRYGWDINLGSGFSTSLQYVIKKKLMLQYNFDIPLIGILWRSHNNSQQLITEEIQLENGIVASAFETPRFSHVFNALYVDNSFKLFYLGSKKINLYYNFVMSYSHITKPLVKKGYEFINAVGIFYKF